MVDKTTQNNDLETNDTHYEDDSTAESDGSQERTYTEAELNERLEAERKERDKRWRERIKNAQDGDEDTPKSSEKGHSKDQKSVVSDEVTLARLEARGVIDQDIQEYLFTAAKREGKNPVELLSDEYFIDRIASMKKAKEKAAATPSPNNRTGRTDHSTDVGYWVEQAKKGVSAPTAELRKQVRQRMAGR